MKARKRRKAQSILEYTLLFGAIIGVIITVLLADGGISDSVEASYTAAQEAIDGVTDSMNQGVFGYR